jgi:hypothetical protein
MTNESLTNSERFLMCLAYLEATDKGDIEQATLIQSSMTPYDFTAGMTVLCRSIFTLYTTKTGEGPDLIKFLRQFGNTMKLEEN